ncbi:MAG: universal stress protein UspA [Myxococcaceae bacterium]|nr:universal stress protein UspA [Myxococcaceae bacterium]
MRKILAAVDGSEPALHAARTAFELAQAMGARLTVVYAVPSPFLSIEVPPTVIDEVIKAEKARGKTILEGVVKALGSDQIGQLELEGPAAEVIADVAEQQGYDLIVVGSRGRNALARIILGSIADRLVHISKTPVLVVK